MVPSVGTKLQLRRAHFHSREVLTVARWNCVVNCDLGSA